MKKTFLGVFVGMFLVVTVLNAWDPTNKVDCFCEGKRLGNIYGDRSNPREAQQKHIWTAYCMIDYKNMENREAFMAGLDHSTAFYNGFKWWATGTEWIEGDWYSYGQFCARYMIIYYKDPLSRHSCWHWNQYDIVPKFMLFPGWERVELETQRNEAKYNSDAFVAGWNKEIIPVLGEKYKLYNFVYMLYSYAKHEYRRVIQLPPPGYWEYTAKRFHYEWVMLYNMNCRQLNHTSI